MLNQHEPVFQASLRFFRHEKKLFIMSNTDSSAKPTMICPIVIVSGNTPPQATIPAAITPWQSNEIEI